MAAEYLQRMGERMAERRKELGLTQEQVARQLPGETSGAHVSRWERGLHRPSDDTLEALAKVLKVDVAYFLAAPAAKLNGTPDPFAESAGLTARVEELHAKLDRIMQALRITDVSQRPGDAEPEPLPPVHPTFADPNIDTAQPAQETTRHKGSQGQAG